MRDGDDAKSADAAATLGDPSGDAPGDAFERLVAIMARLRDPVSGCPWDVEQTFKTIAPYTIEEAYEVADACERDDMDALVDELGDLLLQVVFHARMAEEASAFDAAAVCAAISDKMVRRHPHVFGGDASIDSAEAQTRSWEAQKAAERAAAADRRGDEPPGALDGVAAGLPALTRALKLQKRAARVGFDWPDTASVVAKLDEELDEFRAEVAIGDRDRLTDELGDVLFSLVNVARKLDLDADAALRAANAKFDRRFRAMERAVRGKGRDMANSDLTEMEFHWQAAKSAETPGSGA
jgi:ATP diphosphatase